MAQCGRDEALYLAQKYLVSVRWTFGNNTTHRVFWSIGSDWKSNPLICLNPEHSPVAETQPLTSRGLSG